MRLIRIASTTLALALAVAPAAILGLWTTTASTLQQDDSISRALLELRSNRASIRSDAKTRLVLARSEAIGPVMALLSELLESASKPPVPIEHQPSQPLRMPFEDGSEDPNIWRMINDCCDVLGALRAARAVGLLIRVVEARCTREIVFSKRPNEISAIALIGKPADAALIEELKTAPHLSLP